MHTHPPTHARTPPAPQSVRPPARASPLSTRAGSAPPNAAASPPQQQQGEEDWGV